MLQVLIGIAALFGSAGVALAAAGAHAKPGAGLDTAAYMLLFHAAAVIAACSGIAAKLINRPVGLVATVALLVGTALFAGDLALRAFAGHRLFPMAAPTGGTIQILGWAVLALAAFISSR
jgi:uncharacterized membrane protein YgdD (TMEM256/DUF423 family)